MLVATLVLVALGVAFWLRPESSHLALPSTAGVSAPLTSTAPAAVPNSVPPATTAEASPPDVTLPLAPAPPGAAIRLPGTLGGGVPVRLEDLPVGSRLRRDLAALAPVARETALAKLSELQFHVSDIASLHGLMSNLYKTQGDPANAEKFAKMGREELARLR